MATSPVFDVFSLRSSLALPTGGVSRASHPTEFEPAAPRAVAYPAAVLGLMLAMTGLTFVKELAIFQVIEHGLWMHVYHFARDHYYQCLFLSFAMAVGVTLVPRLSRSGRAATRSPAMLLAALWLVGGMNVFLLTANNGINLLQGRPLHSPHQGIGW